MKDKLNHSTGLLICFILAVAIVLIPFSLRLMTNPSFPGDEAYSHIEKVNHILGSGNDLQGPITCFHIFLTISVILLGKDLGFFILPLIIGGVTLLFYFLILKRFQLKPNEIFIMALFLIFSPIFIYSSYFLSDFPFYVMLSLAALYFLMSENKLGFSISLVIYACLGFSNLFSVIINVIVLLSMIIYSPNLRKRIIPAILIIISVCCAYNLLVYSTLGAPNLAPIDNRNLLQDYLTDLGGIIGFSTFSIILFAISIYFLWKEKYKHISLFLGIIIIALLSLFSSRVNIFLNIALSAMAGYAFLKLINFNWSSIFMKRMIFATIFIGIFLTTYLYSNSIVNSAPSFGTLDSLKELEAYSNGDGRTLGDPAKGYIIEYYSKTEPVINQDSLYDKSYAINQLKAGEIFRSSELETTKKLLHELNVSYIYIDPDSRQNYRFSTPNQGLFYLFRNNETFKRIYSAHDVEIYQVIS